MRMVLQFALELVFVKVPEDFWSKDSDFMGWYLDETGTVLVPLSLEAKPVFRNFSSRQLRKLISTFRNSNIELVEAAFKVAGV